MKGVVVSVSLLDFTLKSRFAREVTVDLDADAVSKVVALPEIPDLTTTYFLRLSAREISPLEAHPALGSHR